MQENSPLKHTHTQARVHVHTHTHPCLSHCLTLANSSAWFLPTVPLRPDRVSRGSLTRPISPPSPPWSWPNPRRHEGLALTVPSARTFSLLCLVGCSLLSSERPSPTAPSTAAPAPTLGLPIASCTDFYDFRGSPSYRKLPCVFSVFLFLIPPSTLPSPARSLCPPRSRAGTRERSRGGGRRWADWASE